MDSPIPLPEILARVAGLLVIAGLLVGIALYARTRTRLAAERDSSDAKHRSDLLDLAKTRDPRSQEQRDNNLCLYCFNRALYPEPQIVPSFHGGTTRTSFLWALFRAVGLQRRVYYVIRSRGDLGIEWPQILCATCEHAHLHRLEERIAQREAAIAQFEIADAQLMNEHAVITVRQEMTASTENVRKYQRDMMRSRGGAPPKAAPATIPPPTGTA